jgi:MFS family permease
MNSRTTTAAVAAETAAPAARGHAAAALPSVCLGFFVIQLDVTIVNVALPAIQRQIGGSLAALQWVIDAYTLALAPIMLTAGSAADPRAGPRRLPERLGPERLLACRPLFPARRRLRGRRQSAPPCHRRRAAAARRAPPAARAAR